MADTVTVRTVPQAGQRARVLFEGLEKDARKWVEDHFPRVHVEPGFPSEGIVPDVALHVTDTDAGIEHFHGPETGWVKPNDQPIDLGKHTDDENV